MRLSTDAAGRRERGLSIHPRLLLLVIHSARPTLADVPLANPPSQSAQSLVAWVVVEDRSLHACGNKAAAIVVLAVLSSHAPIGTQEPRSGPTSPVNEVKRTASAKRFFHGGGSGCDGGRRLGRVREDAADGRARQHGGRCFSTSRAAHRCDRSASTETICDMCGSRRSDQAS